MIKRRNDGKASYTQGDDSMLAILLTAIESDKEKERFIEIYEKYRTYMEQTAIRILKEQSDAEDAVQNAFMQIIKHFEKTYEIPNDNLRFWIISIVKNEALSILRKKKRICSIEDWDGFTNNIDDVVEYSELVTLFTRLPETYRAVLEMKILLGYSDKEISRHLGITVTAVSSRVNRGRLLLREIIRKGGFHV